MSSTTKSARGWGSFSKSSNILTMQAHSNNIEGAVRLYMDYASRLWNETSTAARKRSARDKALDAVTRMEQLVQGEEYFDFENEEHHSASSSSSSLSSASKVEVAQAKQAMLDACRKMSAVLQKQQNTTHTLSASLPTTTSLEPHHHLQQPTHLDHHSPNMHTSSSTALTTTLQSSTSNPTTTTTTTTTTNNKNNSNKVKKAKKPRRSILFGATMGAMVACFVFSGNYVFTGVFTLMTVLGQLEYYRMVMNTGVYPARRISVCGACSMFIAALFAPNLHQLCLPLFSTLAMLWFLTMRRTTSTISEIATTFTGMFYLGYIPSFWVRIRLLGGGREPTRLAPLATPVLQAFSNRATKRLPAFIPKSVHLPMTTGAVFIFWTWLCIAFSDVAGYFVGRQFGKTKLGQIAPAAGATSPNKTVEGVLGGCVVSALLGIVGAWVQKWPYYMVTGTIHGVALALLGLIGDLTASMLKRDAGMKDFGDLIPEHGGIMDRCDSYIFNAPYGWVVCAYVIPWLKGLARARAGLV